MPRWFYNRPPDKCEAMELRVAQKLNDLLPDSWIVRWGYWYADNADTLREGDFLVLGPCGGLAVLEVKTSVSHQASTGHWSEADGDNPVIQLMTEHFGVLSHLQSIACGRKLPFVSKALVLPSLDIATNIPEYRGIPRQLILAGNDLKDFESSWVRLFNGRRMPVSVEQTTVFLDAYGEGLEPKSVKAFISETDKLLLRQATSNYRLLDMLAGNQQLVVEGGVGTGKSWYAIEQARRLAENANGESGREVLMVAYNIALCERLRVSTRKLRLTRGSITVQNAAHIAASIIESSGIAHEVPESVEELRRYYDETLPRLALEAVHSESTKLTHLLGRYDALVVDEAQDHDTCLSGDESSTTPHLGWWSLYVSLLKDGWQAPIVMFGDQAQRPPFRAADRFDLERVRHQLPQHAHLRLQHALRYTRPIYRFLQTLDGEGSRHLVASLQSDGPLPEGPDVEIHQGPASEIPALVTRVLDHWQTTGLCDPNKVLILYERSRIDATALADLDSLLDHPLRPYLEIVDQPFSNAIGHSSIHKAKGLDALAVILVGLRPFDQLTKSYDRFTYFMGASRARQLLACVHLAESSHAGG